MKEIKNQESDPKTPWWQPSLILFTKLSGWIAGPVIIAVFIGKWLDREFKTEPWLFLSSVGLAFLLSMAGIVYNTLKEYKKIEEDSKKNKLKK